ncbi:MAG TPA: PilZ domain-containing protein [Polyangiaceae bacterium]|nr:PilZ domain-containing protein [Polyangiaceae bacterium]
MEQGPPSGIERRRHPRFDVLAQVRVKQSQSDLVTELDNVSLSGARLHLGKLRRPGWIAVDRVIEITIVHPVDLENIDVQGRVVRVEEDAQGTRVAVCFTDLDDRAQQGIARLVESARSAFERRGPPPLPR